MALGYLLNLGGQHQSLTTAAVSGAVPQLLRAILFEKSKAHDPTFLGAILCYTIWSMTS